jgi:hypothetical protein
MSTLVQYFFVKKKHYKMEHITVTPLVSSLSAALVNVRLTLKYVPKSNPIYVKKFITNVPKVTDFNGDVSS